MLRFGRWRFWCVPLLRMRAHGRDRTTGRRRPRIVRGIGLPALAVVSVSLLCRVGSYTELGVPPPADPIEQLQLRLPSDRVVDIMGAPFAQRIKETLPNGNTLIVWEYVRENPERYRIYWLTLVNDLLVHWGSPADFETFVAEHNLPIQVP